MILSINNAVTATYIFTILLAFVFLLSVRWRQGNGLDVSASTELKGLAILAIVFSHVGYFLVSDTRFLFPLSSFAGVGVDIFLFLSGFGLAVSQIKKDNSVWQFYKQRLLKLMLPFWLILLTFFTLDIIFLQSGYSATYILRSFLGFFPRADLYKDINSPLWYFTFILGCYLVFPLFFSKKRPCLSALAIYVALYLFWQLSSNFFPEVAHLYRVHLVAFPLGVLIARVLQNEKLSAKIKSSALFDKIYNARSPWHYILLFLSFGIFCYSIYHSGVGHGPFWEQLVSLISVAAISIFFAVKKFSVKLLALVGVYSYEVYLLHWPIMYRYDFLFKYFPSWLAMALYVAVFIALGWVLQFVAKFIVNKLSPKKLS